LLADRGDEAGLHALADSGNDHAAERLSRLLADRGDEAGLHALADSGNDHAAFRLAELLADRGDEAERQAEVHACVLLVDRGGRSEIRSVSPGASPVRDHAGPRAERPCALGPPDGTTVLRRGWSPLAYGA
jgi:hypothetical protein